MTTEIVTAALTSDYTTIDARDLQWTDLGRLTAVQTEAAILVGYLHSYAVYTRRSGGQAVHITVKRGTVEAKDVVEGDHQVFLSNSDRVSNDKLDD